MCALSWTNKRCLRFSYVSFLDGIEHDCSTDDFLEFAQNTEGWSGADLRNLIREAALQPLRRMLAEMSKPPEEFERDETNSNTAEMIVPDSMTKEDVVAAFKVIKPTSAQRHSGALQAQPVAVSAVHPRHDSREMSQETAGKSPEAV